MYYVDSDNAMGSSFGDVDDAYAIASLFLSSIPLIALGSVSGNTSSCKAFENNRKLAQIFNISIPVLKAEETVSFLGGVENTLKILALGPLTNVSKLIDVKCKKITEVVLVGSNFSSRGKYPPYYPYEFNLVKDRLSALKVLNSEVPVTIVPLDVAKRFQISEQQVKKLPGRFGEYLHLNSRRWFFRSRLLKLKNTVPLWDLVASLYVIDPSLFKTQRVRANIHPNTWIDYKSGDRELTVVQDFDPGELWERFERLFPGVG